RRGGPWMVAAGLEQVAARAAPGRGVLPFGFGRQARLRPARIGVGLIIADVAHGLVGSQPEEARQREDLRRRGLELAPVQWRADLVFAAPAEAIRQPELGPVIA